MKKTIIEEYEAHLKKLRDENSILKIKNDSFAHAQTLVSNLFEHAQKEVLIYTSSLCHQFYTSDKIIASFEQLKEKNIVPKIIIQYDFSRDEQFKDVIKQQESIEGMKKIFGDDFSPVFLSSEPYTISYQMEDGTSLAIHNFTVVDEKTFRYEKFETKKGDCVNPDGKYTNAVGCFNDQETTALLAETFRKHYKTQA